jgi:hypothetical protein
MSTSDEPRWILYVRSFPACVAVALAAGLTLREAAALARHANPRVTATVYAGLTDAGRAGLGAKLAEAFGA